MFLRKIPLLPVFLIFCFFLAGCSEYSRVLKSDDPTWKLEKAKEYYHAEEYHKALPLFEELIALYRGTNQSEEIYFLYAQCYYGLSDYYLSSYYFKNFIKTYPTSKYAEESMFMSAFSNYQISPIPSLDQTETRIAINEFQSFLNRYPQTELKDSVNVLMEELRMKLEMKAYENAKLYFRTENYKSAVVALNNVIKEFPNSPHKEEIDFLIVRSNYLLAINSIEEKKAERLNETIESYFNFVDKYNQSRYLKQAENYYSNAVRELEKMATIN